MKPEHLTRSLAPAAARRRIASLLTVSLFTLLLALSPVGTGQQPAQAQEAQPALNLLVPNGFSVDLFAHGLELPTSFDFAPDGRIFVTEKQGRVRIIQNGQLLPTPFIDISDRINTFGDRGLMSVAVHPRFPAVPWVWLAYSYEPPEAADFPRNGARVSRVVRVQASPGNSNVALPDSEVIVVGSNSTFAHIGNPGQMDAPPYTCYDANNAPIQDCLPNEGNSHNVGTLRFGPDGALYVGSGDGINYGFGSLRAQDINVLAGKILRVDPMTGRGYPNNPFYDGNPESNASKIFALGMRNPWRFNFHPTTRVLYAADVGNNRWEEINRVPAGANLGWPCFEGPRENAFDPECEPALSGSWPVTQAYYAYEHESGGRGAAIGGDFPRGRGFPAGYQGNFFFGEFNVATIEQLIQAPDGSVQRETFASGAYGVVEIKFGPDGALYFASVYTGELYRIRYTATGNRAPIARISASPTQGDPPLTVNFSSTSYDPDGDPLRYEWRFGDGEVSSQHNPTHTYAEAGRYVVNFTVTDNANASATAQLTIVVGDVVPATATPAPTATATPTPATSPTPGPTGQAGEAATPSPTPTVPPSPTAQSEPAAGAEAPTASATPTVAATSAAVEAAPVAGQGSGRILWEQWRGVSGSSIDDLRNHPRYPDRPDRVSFLTSLETPRTLEPDYGSRIRGYLHPPVSGLYRFLIASDDQSGLWLSTDERPANAIYIAGVPDWTGMRQWDKYPEQISGYIRLEAGQRYYIEIIHKQYDGRDNLAVAWQMMDGPIEIIDGRDLSGD